MYKNINWFKYTDKKLHKLIQMTGTEREINRKTDIKTEWKDNELYINHCLCDR